MINKYLTALCRLLSVTLLAAATLTSTPLQAEKIHVLKFATLAPAGTTWVQLLREWANEVRQESHGRLIFKIYPGAVQGDEPEVLKKIRFGQLQGGAFTGYGIGQIYSPTRVLELPFLFNNIEEIDYIRQRFMPEIEQGFRDNGYELLGWMEVGYIYFFSKAPIQTLDDLKQRRIWNWQGDPLGQAFFEASGLSPIPLSIIDVYTSLSTGLIDTVYAPPLGAIAMQWFTKTQYITNLPMANGIGSLVVSRRFFHNLPQDLQKILKRTGAVIGAKLVTATRKDNIDSLEILERRGMQIVEAEESLKSDAVQGIRIRAGESLMKNGYIPEATINKINQWLQDFREEGAAEVVNAAD
ncbi:MAG: TRAP transporter substrate-binding protein DctP [Gammaproteobacteria bacterium]|nr:TRAP transporter substrate-binding protein DctP [Gammaproteobacteria bacterium]